MMMSPMPRSTFNTTYNYRLVVWSDNIDLKHCGNCTHALLKGIETMRKEEGCFLMVQCDIPSREIIVNRRRGLCDLWQRRKEKKDV